MADTLDTLRQQLLEELAKKEGIPVEAEEAKHQDKSIEELKSIVLSEPSKNSEEAVIATQGSSKGVPGSGISRLQEFPSTAALRGVPATAPTVSVLDSSPAGFAQWMAKSPLAPTKLRQDIDKSLRQGPPKPEVSSPAAETKPTEPSTGAETPKPPKSYSEFSAKSLANLWANSAKLSSDLYGEEADRIKEESAALQDALKVARQTYEADTANARSDYEKDKTRQQWAQVAEIIGRSLVTLGAAYKSVVSGKNMVGPGVSPESKVDWLGQLRELRADLDDRLTAANKRLGFDEGEAKLKNAGQREAREMEFTGKRQTFAEQMDTLREQERRTHEAYLRGETRAERREDREWGMHQAATQRALDKTDKMAGDEYSREARGLEARIDAFIKEPKESRKTELLKNVRSSLVALGVPVDKVTEVIDKNQKAWYLGGGVTDTLKFDVLNSADDYLQETALKRAKLKSGLNAQAAGSSPTAAAPASGTVPAPAAESGVRRVKDAAELKQLRASGALKAGDKIFVENLGKTVEFVPSK